VAPEIARRVNAEISVDTGTDPDAIDADDLEDLADDLHLIDPDTPLPPIGDDSANTTGHGKDKHHTKGLKGKGGGEDD
jgi:hypothetical protein